MQISQTSGLRGVITVPGDKSISHRSVMMGALAKGTSRITGFLMGEDCLSTISCFQKMGVNIKVSPKEIIIYGVGKYGLQESDQILDTGNSGTTTRLLAGLLSGQRFSSILNGDASIQKRPMDRIIFPLTKMGADITGENGNYCPLTIHGRPLHGITYFLPVASAQLKSAVLLAGLYADSPTTIIEPTASRNHTEQIFRLLGIPIETNDREITLSPAGTWDSMDFSVPGDLSSAAFFMVAGIIVPNSEITIKNVGLNPTRTGILDVLKDMGANITISDLHGDAEPICNLTVSSSSLHGAKISGDLIPRLIDELPILAVAAAFAEGETVIADAEELKIKESNRITAMVTELQKAGIHAVETEDGMIIQGGSPVHGARFNTYKDHRIAMSLSILALAASGLSEILEPSVVSISYPEFFHTLSILKGEKDAPDI